MTQPENQVAATGQVNKMHGPPVTEGLPNTWLPELLRPGKGTKHMTHLVLCPCGVLENLSGLDLGSALNTRLT